MEQFQPPANIVPTSSEESRQVETKIEEQDSKQKEVQKKDEKMIEEEQKERKRENDDQAGPSMPTALVPESTAQIPVPLPIAIQDDPSMSTPLVTESSAQTPALPPPKKEIIIEKHDPKQDKGQKKKDEKKMKEKEQKKQKEREREYGDQNGPSTSIMLVPDSTVQTPDPHPNTIQAGSSTSTPSLPESTSQTSALLPTAIQNGPSTSDPLLTESSAQNPPEEDAQIREHRIQAEQAEAELKRYREVQMELSKKRKSNSNRNAPSTSAAPPLPESSSQNLPEEDPQNVPSTSTAPPIKKSSAVKRVKRAAKKRPSVNTSARERAEEQAKIPLEHRAPYPLHRGQIRKLPSCRLIAKLKRVEKDGEWPRGADAVVRELAGVYCSDRYGVDRDRHLLAILVHVEIERMAAVGLVNFYRENTFQRPSPTNTSTAPAPKELHIKMEPLTKHGPMSVQIKKESDEEEEEGAERAAPEDESQPGAKVARRSRRDMESKSKKERQKRTPRTRSRRGAGNERSYSTRRVPAPQEMPQRITRQSTKRAMEESGAVDGDRKSAVPSTQDDVVLAKKRTRAEASDKKSLEPEDSEACLEDSRDEETRKPCTSVRTAQANADQLEIRRLTSELNEARSALAAIRKTESEKSDRIQCETSRGAMGKGSEVRPPTTDHFPEYPPVQEALERIAREYASPSPEPPADSIGSSHVQHAQNFQEGSPERSAFLSHVTSQLDQQLLHSSATTPEAMTSSDIREEHPASTSSTSPREETLNPEPSAASALEHPEPEPSSQEALPQEPEASTFDCSASEVPIQDPEPSTVEHPGPVPSSIDHPEQELPIQNASSSTAMEPLMDHQNSAHSSQEATPETPALESEPSLENPAPEPTVTDVQAPEETSTSSDNMDQESSATDSSFLKDLDFETGTQEALEPECDAAGPPEPFGMKTLAEEPLLEYRAPESLPTSSGLEFADLASSSLAPEASSTEIPAAHPDVMDDSTSATDNQEVLAPKDDAAGPPEPFGTKPAPESLVTDVPTPEEPTVLTSSGFDSSSFDYVAPEASSMGIPAAQPDVMDDLAFKMDKEEAVLPKEDAAGPPESFAPESSSLNHPHSDKETATPEPTVMEPPVEKPLLECSAPEFSVTDEQTPEMSTSSSNYLAPESSVIETPVAQPDVMENLTLKTNNEESLSPNENAASPPESPAMNLRARDSIFMDYQDTEYPRQEATTLELSSEVPIQDPESPVTESLAPESSSSQVTTPEPTPPVEKLDCPSTVMDVAAPEETSMLTSTGVDSSSSDSVASEASSTEIPATQSAVLEDLDLRTNEDDAAGLLAPEPSPLEHHDPEPNTMEPTFDQKSATKEVPAPESTDESPATPESSRQKAQSSDSNKLAEGSCVKEAPEEGNESFEPSTTAFDQELPSQEVSIPTPTALESPIAAVMNQHAPESSTEEVLAPEPSAIEASKHSAPTEPPVSETPRLEQPANESSTQESARPPIPVSSESPAPESEPTTLESPALEFSASDKLDSELSTERETPTLKEAPESTSPVASTSDESDVVIPVAVDSTTPPGAFSNLDQGARRSTSSESSDATTSGSSTAESSESTSSEPSTTPSPIDKMKSMVDRQSSESAISNLMDIKSKSKPMKTEQASTAPPPTFPESMNVVKRRAGSESGQRRERRRKIDDMYESEEQRKRTRHLEGENQPSISNQQALVAQATGQVVENQVAVAQDAPEEPTVQEQEAVDTLAQMGRRSNSGEAPEETSAHQQAPPRLVHNQVLSSPVAYDRLLEGEGQLEIGVNYNERGLIWRHQMMGEPRESMESASSSMPSLQSLKSQEPEEPKEPIEQESSNWIRMLESLNVAPLVVNPNFGNLMKHSWKQLVPKELALLTEEQSHVFSLFIKSTQNRLVTLTPHQVEVLSGITQQYPSFRLMSDALVQSMKPDYESSSTQTLANTVDPQLLQNPDLIAQLATACSMPQELAVDTQSLSTVPQPPEPKPSIAFDLSVGYDPVTVQSTSDQSTSRAAPEQAQPALGVHHSKPPPPYTPSIRMAPDYTAYPIGQLPTGPPPCAPGTSSQSAPILHGMPSSQHPVYTSNEQLPMRLPGTSSSQPAEHKAPILLGMLSSHQPCAPGTSNASTSQSAMLALPTYPGIPDTPLAAPINPMLLNGQLPMIPLQQLNVPGISEAQKAESQRIYSQLLMAQQSSNKRPAVPPVQELPPSFQRPAQPLPPIQSFSRNQPGPSHAAMPAPMNAQPALPAPSAYPQFLPNLVNPAALQALMPNLLPGFHLNGTFSDFQNVPWTPLFPQPVRPIVDQADINRFLQPMNPMGPLNLANINFAQLGAPQPGRKRQGAPEQGGPPRRRDRRDDEQ